MVVETLPLSYVFVLGIVFGIGPCTLTCLPYLGPIFLSQSGGVKASWKIVVPFSLGRLISYSSLGLLAGYLGQTLRTSLKTPVIGWILGVATICVGLYILWTTLNKHSSKGGCGAHGGMPHHSKLSKVMPGSLFFMGMGMALTPCSPLSTVLLVSAASASALTGFSLGFSFGIGAVMVPALIFGLGMAYFGQRIREILANSRKKLELASGGILIVMGLETIFA
jgi:cytochrome c biogenesis protein CcdA